ncbi:MAG: GWxTD domain-containing protein [Bacteroidota bacterium]
MKKIILLAFAVVLFAGCFLTNKISNQNLAYVYKTSLSFLHPEFLVNNFSDDSSRLYFKVNADELLYTRQDDQKFSAIVKLQYMLFATIDAQAIIDSGSVTLKDSKGDTVSNIITGHLDLKTGSGSYKILQVKLTDMNRKQSVVYFVKIDKSTMQSRQTFTVMMKNSTQPYFHNYIAATDTFRVKYRDASVSKLFVKYYNRNFLIALPPFAIENPQGFDYHPDSLFTVDISGNDYLNFKKPGFYHFQLDTSNHEGLTLYRFTEDFPSTTIPQALIDPLRYINTRKEFEELSNTQNKKLSLDKFWMGMGGNQDRSKELIRRFYNRVINANIFFTSHMEGWKTDRGLIYIVFGAPNVVYKGENSESWTYGESGSMLSINFNFERVNNPFTDNDYTLERAPLYETQWYRAVDSWRQGRVFSD